jgi:NAD(P)-dependent dehydrogenase (short-subunit alcohol dehydrogenase family)
MGEGDGGERSARGRKTSQPSPLPVKTGFGGWFARWRRSVSGTPSRHSSDGAALTSGSDETFEPTVFERYEHANPAPAPRAGQGQDRGKGEGEGQPVDAAANGAGSDAGNEPGNAAARAIAIDSDPAETALIVGAGPRWALALADALAGHGMKVAFAGAHGPRLELLAARLRTTGCPSAAYACDVTHEADVRRVFKALRDGLGAPDLVVWAQPAGRLGPALDQSETALEDAWREHGLAALFVAREAARGMVARGRGTIVLAQSGLQRVGQGDLFNANLGPLGPHAMAQELARQWWSQGVHVCQLIADAEFEPRGEPRTEARTEPRSEARSEARTEARSEGNQAARAPTPPQCELEEVAQAVLQLHLQPRSAWARELRLRPWNAPLL